MNARRVEQAVVTCASNSEVPEGLLKLLMKFYIFFNKFWVHSERSCWKRRYKIKDYGKI